MAPPIPLGPDNFTKEELASYGMSEEEICDLMETSEWLLQWSGVPQGLAPVAPFPPVYLSDAVNRMFGREWRDWWVCCVDDCLCWGYTREQCTARSRLLTVALRMTGKEVSEKVDRSVKEHGTVAGLKFTAGGCVLDDSAVESVKVTVALDEVMAAKRVSEAMVRKP